MKKGKGLGYAFWVDVFRFELLLVKIRQLWEGKGLVSESV
jgi:hypothetical protein